MRISTRFYTSWRDWFYPESEESTWQTGSSDDENGGSFREVWELDVASAMWRLIDIPPNALIENGAIWVKDRLIWVPTGDCLGTYTYHPESGQWGSTTPIDKFAVGAFHKFSVNGRLTTIGLFEGHAAIIDLLVRQLHLE